MDCCYSNGSLEIIRDDSENDFEEDANSKATIDGNDGSASNTISVTRNDPDDADDENCFVIRMDISEPLHTIKTILSAQVDGIADYLFTLQDSEELDERSNLLDYCIEGEGLVQVNVEIKNDANGQRIDITDVLKPEDDDDDEQVKIEQLKKPLHSIQPQFFDKLTKLPNPEGFDQSDKKKRPARRQTGTKDAVKKMKLDIPNSSPSQSTPTASETSQIQLWQFLLELLVDYKYRNLISWLGTDGEFVLRDPSKVAKLWGARKNNPNMTYESMSRSLRYYYAGDMITKVSGKKLVYKFTCDLEFLLGFTPAELDARVVQAEEHAKPATSQIHTSDDYPYSISPSEGFVITSDFTI